MRPTTRSCGRRPRSAKARSRGKLGRGDAASYGICPRRVIRKSACKFCVIGWWPDHNFGVTAQSLLIGEVTFASLVIPKNYVLQKYRNLQLPRYKPDGNL